MAYKEVVDPDTAEITYVRDDEPVDTLWLDGLTAEQLSSLTLDDTVDHNNDGILDTTISWDGGSVTILGLSGFTLEQLESDGVIVFDYA
jgi:hypothetical protein